MSGTYVDRRAPRGVMVVFLAVALVAVALPSVGMLWARTDATTENRELAPAPTLVSEDGSPNVNFLADAGDYFNDHFAYRNNLVALNAYLRAALGSPATDQVVVGTDGWLYYAGTLNDYLGRSRLSERSLANIAHNLKLVQGYVESKGATFAFTIAPNKNTLYDQNMPFYYVRSPYPSNAERLVPLLEQAGVNYVNLFEVVPWQDETMYLKRDTHWDNRGALLAARAILQQLGRVDLLADMSSAEVRDDFVGDLQTMLYPDVNRTEPNYYYAGYHELEGSDDAVKWAYEEGADVTDNQVTTRGAGQGNLLMFRDSFGNALLPFFAASFEKATFSKLVPYNLPALVKAEASAVVIERAERHLADLATDPPFLPNPALKLQNGIPEGMRQVEATYEFQLDGSYWTVRGTVDQQLDAESQLYLSVEQPGADPVFYNPFWTSIADEEDIVQADNGFLAYLPSSVVDLDSATVKVYVKM